MTRYDEALRGLARELSGSSATPIHDELRSRLLPVLEAAEIVVSTTYNGWPQIEALRSALDTLLKGETR